MKRIFITLAVLMGLAGIVKCDDIPLAAGLAQAGAKLAAAGKTEQAEQTLYRALVYDEHCGLAYFELAKLAEKSGDKEIARNLYHDADAVLIDGIDKLECKKKLVFFDKGVRMIQQYIDEYAKSKSLVLSRFIVNNGGRHKEVEVIKSKTSLAGEWRGQHWAWSATLIIKDDGTFTQSRGLKGTWTSNPTQIILNWDGFDPETLTRVNDDEYVASEQRGRFLLKRSAR